MKLVIVKYWLWLGKIPNQLQTLRLSDYYLKKKIKFVRVMSLFNFVILKRQSVNWEHNVLQTPISSFTLLYFTLLRVCVCVWGGGGGRWGGEGGGGRELIKVKGRNKIKNGQSQKRCELK